MSLARFLAWSSVLAAAALLVACGKEGPPLPPLVRLPSPPVELRAERRGEVVDVSFAVPSENTDGSRPADLERVDVYAITAAPTVSDDQLLEHGTMVGSVEVKPPPPEDATVPPDAADAEPPPATGLDQGATATVTERLTDAALVPVDLSSTLRTAGQASPAPRPALPLAGPPLVPPSRVYAGVGVSPRGRRGPFSTRAAAPLIAAPAPIRELRLAYDEDTIDISWDRASSSRPVQEPAGDDVLPARIVGLVQPATGYNVYEVREAAETRLTNPAIEATRYEDGRIEWGTERCYLVRVVQALEALSLESAGSPVVCVTPADTFAPRPPTNVQVVPSEGAIRLIWQRGDEKDLAGFIVLRSAGPAGALAAVTPMPIQETSFVDAVGPGERYAYAVQAVDSAGNTSEPSARSEPVEAR